MTELLKTGLRIAGTFSVICILWSLWTCESLSDWLALWPRAFVWNASILEVAGLLLIAVIGVGLAAWFASLKPGRPMLRSTAISWVLLLGFSLGGLPQVYSKAPPEVATMVLNLRSPHLSPRDAARLERSYYDELVDVGRFNDPLDQMYTNQAAPWLDVGGSGLKRFTGDFMEYDLKPSVTAKTATADITTNRWGMRDRDYELVPAKGTFRVALLGASLVMGWGVEEGETFENLLEERLNSDFAGTKYETYEILNFAAPGYYPLQQAPVLEKALGFDPDMVVFLATGREFTRSAYYLGYAVKEGLEIPYAPLRAIVDEARADIRAKGTSLESALKERKEKILEWLYAYLVSTCRENSIEPVWIFLPQLEDGPWQDETEPAVQLAESAGFKVLNLLDVYGDNPSDKTRVSESDLHPNAFAHRLIAERLYEVLSGWEDIFVRSEPEQ